MMEAWKTTTYPDAWRYMEECAAAVLAPGWLATPWGRKRYFPQTSDEQLVASMQRESQNYPIQSTVADTCMIAMQLMKDEGIKRNLHFRLVNQVHDALMYEVPEDEISETKHVFADAMGSIRIPMPVGDPLVLGVDVTVMERWGVKRKK